MTTEEFWRDRLRDYFEPNQISVAKRPGLELLSPDYIMQELHLTQEIADALRSLSQDHNIDIYTVLLGAWSLLLSHYSASEDILFGVISEPSCLLPLRVKITPALFILPWLHRVKAEWLAIEIHKDVSISVLQEWSNFPADTRLFESCLDFRDIATPGLIGYPLCLKIGNGKSPSLKLYYDQQRFEKNVIARLLDHLQTLLAGIAINPQQKLGDLTILPTAEKHQLLVEWNATEVDYPRDKCIHHIFEEQVKRSPEAVAVIMPHLGQKDDQRLTYCELNRRANLLADRLKQMGVGVGTFVAICMERSLETIVAILGILKVGGVYVPLDPAYPQERLNWMLEDTQAPVLITQSHLLDRWPTQQAQLLCLETNWGTNSDLEPICSTKNLDSSNLAYVNYTSGSTGRPKGVSIPHSGVMRLVLGTDYACLDSQRTILQLAPISFDAATFEIWGALLHGGCCVLFPGNGIPDPKELGVVIKNYQISTLWLTAALFNTIITEAPESLKDVKEILTGGEALSLSHIRKALDLLPETQLINGYGPTESTTFTCCYRIPRQLDSNLTSIPIGKPIANTQVYILNSRLQPVPMGIPGELHIGGDGLAREYLNRPDLTQEKFIPNPFASGTGVRLYKTGDLVSYLSDGNIEFIGRKDDLVKIRGYRIELGEIEASISQHDSVRDAVVIVREDRPGDKRLVAYVTSKEERQIIVSELKSYLKQQVPEYMIPAAIVGLDKIPLTPNGKVDRRSLPIPATQKTELEANFIAPSNPTEKTLAEIWCGVLGLSQVGIEDNFFDLGGTSLLGIQLVARIQKQFGDSFNAVKLYQYPTVRTLASYFSQTEEAKDQSYQNMQARAQRQRAAQINRQRPINR